MRKIIVSIAYGIFAALVWAGIDAIADYFLGPPPAPRLFYLAVAVAAAGGYYAGTAYAGSRRPYRISY